MPDRSVTEATWDDRGATPGDVPVHDWQREELARRKANLQKHPDSRGTGRTSSNGSATAMAADLIPSPKSELPVNTESLFHWRKID